MHPYNAGTEHVRCSPTTQTLLAPRGGRGGRIIVKFHVLPPLGCRRTKILAEEATRSLALPPVPTSRSSLSFVALFCLNFADLRCGREGEWTAFTSREGCTRFMDSHNLKTIDPLIPSTPGESTLGFRRPGRHRVHQARSAPRCLVSRTKGELHAPYQEPLVRRTSPPPVYSLAYRMTASNKSIRFLVWPLPEASMGMLCSWLVDALPYAQ